MRNPAPETPATVHRAAPTGARSGGHDWPPRSATGLAHPLDRTAARTGGRAPARRTSVTRATAAERATGASGTARTVRRAEL